MLAVDEVSGYSVRHRCGRSKPVQESTDDNERGDDRHPAFTYRTVREFGAELETPHRKNPYEARIFFERIARSRIKKRPVEISSNVYFPTDVWRKPPRCASTPIPDGERAPPTKT